MRKKSRSLFIIGLLLLGLIFINAENCKARILNRLELQNIVNRLETLARNIQNGTIVRGTHALDVNFADYIDLFETAKERLNLTRKYIEIPVQQNGYEIVSDIHGALDAAYQAFQAKENRHLVVLGDFIDRDPNSLETAAYFLCKWLLNPDEITILRGNHEFLSLHDWLFPDHIFSIIGNYLTNPTQRNQMKRVMQDAFDLLPIGAEILDQNGRPFYFCVHGGIGADFATDLPRLKNWNPATPITMHDRQFYDFLCADINIAYPNTRWTISSTPYSYPSHNRSFGRPLLKEFCQAYGFRGIFRGHQHGIGEKFFLDGTVNNHGQMQEVRCYTIATSPSVAYYYGSQGRVLFVNPDMSVTGQLLLNNPTATFTGNPFPLWQPQVPQISVKPKVSPTPPQPRPAPIAQKPAVNNNSRPASTKSTLPFAPVFTEPVMKVMHRLYNQNSGLHHYTAEEGEVAGLLALGWLGEPDAFPFRTEGMPVYRLYNRNDGNHHFTMDANERDSLIAAGWEYEGIAFYVAEINGGVPVYRAYNLRNGEHFYTTSYDEIENAVAYGWINEGIAFWV
ncbi:MAG: metallophosphoesterase [Lactobacillales bacterium]|jgi:hypothetical protein|nr:metallophosphoesterase [Lactobacillales bacterium]